jgi:heme/copper-type cytochrome/quinol oxidase subunit 2
MLAGPLSAVLVVVMFAGCLLLWVGLPLGWLWIGSQIQAATSLGTALMATMVGIIVSIFVVVSALSWVNHRHARLREARDLPPADQSALEIMFVASAAVAVAVFALWFFVFAGTSPVPLELGY